MEEQARARAAAEGLGSTAPAKDAFPEYTPKKQPEAAAQHAVQQQISTTRPTKPVVQAATHVPTQHPSQLPTPSESEKADAKPVLVPEAAPETGGPGGFKSPFASKTSRSSAKSANKAAADKPTKKASGKALTEAATGAAEEADAVDMASLPATTAPVPTPVPTPAPVPLAHPPANPPANISITQKSGLFTSSRDGTSSPGRKGGRSDGSVSISAQILARQPRRYTGQDDDDADLGWGDDIPPFSDFEDPVMDDEPIRGGWRNRRAASPLTMPPPLYHEDDTTGLFWDDPSRPAGSVMPKEAWDAMRTTYPDMHIFELQYKGEISLCVATPDPKNFILDYFLNNSLISDAKHPPRSSSVDCTHSLYLDVPMGERGNLNAAALKDCQSMRVIVRTQDRQAYMKGYSWRHEQGIESLYEEKHTMEEWEDSRLAQSLKDGRKDDSRPVQQS